MSLCPCAHVPSLTTMSTCELAPVVLPRQKGYGGQVDRLLMRLAPQQGFTGITNFPALIHFDLGHGFNCVYSRSTLPDSILHTGE